MEEVDDFTWEVSLQGSRKEDRGQMIVLVMPVSIQSQAPLENIRADVEAPQDVAQFLSAVFHRG